MVETEISVHRNCLGFFSFCRLVYIDMKPLWCAGLAFLASFTTLGFLRDKKSTLWHYCWRLCRLCRRFSVRDSVVMSESFSSFSPSRLKDEQQQQQTQPYPSHHQQHFQQQQQNSGQLWVIICIFIYQYYTLKILHREDKQQEIVLINWPKMLN